MLKRKLAKLILNLQPETIAFQSAVLVAGGNISSSRLRLINKTISSLKYNDLWSTLDGLWVLAASDASTASINWKNPGSNTITLNNTPTFISDRGYTTNGTNDYVILNYTPATAGSLFVQDSAQYSVWSLTTGQVGSSGNGIFTTTNQTTINPRNTSDQITARVNNAASTITVSSITDGSGFYTATRTTSTLTTLFKNGVSQGTSATASGSFTAGALARLGEGGGGFAARQWAMASAGAGLDTTKSISFYNIMLSYMQSVGAA